MQKPVVLGTWTPEAEETQRGGRTATEMHTEQERAVWDGNA